MIQNLHPYDILALSDVVRWHTTAMARAQTLGDHKARVALLAVWLGHQLGPGRFAAHDELETMRLALLHDMPETQLGDMPAPSKRALNEHLGEVPGVPGAQDYDAVMEAAFWEGRGCASPFATAHNLPLSLMRCADALCAATYYMTYGLTRRRPGSAGPLAFEIVREAMAVVRRERPELLEDAAAILRAACVPENLLAELVKVEEASA